MAKPWTASPTKRKAQASQAQKVICKTIGSTSLTIDGANRFLSLIRTKPVEAAALF
jgi:ribosome biogenesis SPOUT family RNA methylase Rps3